MMNYLALLEDEDRRVTYRRGRTTERDALLARRLSRHIHVLLLIHNARVQHRWKPQSIQPAYASAAGNAHDRVRYERGR